MTQIRRVCIETIGYNQNGQEDQGKLVPLKRVALPDCVSWVCFPINPAAFFRYDIVLNWRIDLAHLLSRLNPACFHLLKRDTYEELGDHFEGSAEEEGVGEIRLEVYDIEGETRQKNAYHRTTLFPFPSHFIDTPRFHSLPKRRPSEVPNGDGKEEAVNGHVCIGGEVYQRQGKD